MHKIMVVEDEELISTMIRINLQKEGFEVDCRGNAESMLETVTRESHDAILLDINLPGSSGIEALGSLRRSGVNTPVLMITAKSDIESKINCLNLGSDDYITKPFNMNELIARVKALIRRSGSGGAG